MKLSHRSLSLDLKVFDSDIERTLKALREKSKITDTCEVNMTGNLRALRECFIANTYNSPIVLNTLPANYPNVQSVCAIRSSPSHAIYDCPSASIFPELVQEKVHAAQGFQRKNDPYSNTSPQPSQDGNSIFGEKVLSALKSLEAKAHIIDSHAQCIATLET
ncbi:hypothetical protein M9H77_35785 [Catharanthus roseus]|uniref:Uncharacterized protein n=1 Tax=Catharanthus roseus TaxID=4058 RepID=A0ACB9ZTN5_CATRO|nr:hypothetical protein M9H77_35785 [Catharanthus roseus]